MRKLIIPLLLALVMTSCASYTVRTGLDAIGVPQQTALTPTKLSEIQAMNSALQNN